MKFTKSKGDVMYRYVIFIFFAKILSKKLSNVLIWKIIFLGETFNLVMDIVDNHESFLLQALCKVENLTVILIFYSALQKNSVFLPVYEVK